MECTLSSKCHGGTQHIYKHYSTTVNCTMNFSIYLPPHADGEKLPVLYYLSGLTCSEKNFIEKSGFQKYASKHKIIVVGPDTSPRGCNIDGENATWDFGTGASFYVDSTEEKWKEYYQMYSYVTKELPAFIEENFPTNGKKSIFGHSMGGHGALMCTLKNPGQYKSVSAFSPVCNPTACPWGVKCFSGYLGDDKNAWKEYDSTLLVKSYSGPKLSILIDQGTADQFLADQLLPENFKAAVSESDAIELELRMQEGYDHSYYFISSFIHDHFTHHAKFLC